MSPVNNTDRNPDKSSTAIDQIALGDNHAPTMPPAKALLVDDTSAKQFLRQIGVLTFAVSTIILYLGLAFLVIQVPAIAGPADSPNTMRVTIAVGLITIVYACIVRYYLTNYTERKWVAAHGACAKDQVTARRLPRDVVKYVTAITLCAWVLGQVFARGSYVLFGSAGFDAVTGAINEANLLTMLFLAVVIAPVSEEMLMRGVIYPVLRTRFSAYAACIITACLFGALHGNVVQFIITIPLSIIAAWVYEMSRNITYCIMVHMIFNVTALFIPTTWMIELDVTQLAALAAVTTAVLGVAIATMVRRAQHAYQVDTTTDAPERDMLPARDD